MFVDVACIKISAGNGGDGAVSFHRDKYTASGGPDGGNGGAGGDVIFMPDANMSTLSSFRYQKTFKASNGQNGASGNRSGRSGENITIKVPFGTLLKNTVTNKLIFDISLPKPYIIAKGGKGGAGNMNFSNPVRQSPRFSKPGGKGEEFELKLELKLLADVGLVGYPNVGKSTIISMLSEAKPQIANYHFTTLSPILGVVKYSQDLSFVMADIPGLIEGAWKGTGLGHQFLRHVERCRLLVHVVDVSGSEGRDPQKDFDIINRELKKFNEELSDKPMIIAGNKCDIAAPEQIEKFKKYVTDKGYKFISLSAAANQGMKEFKDLVANELTKLPPLTIFSPDANSEIVTDAEDKLEIKNVNGVYIVNAKWVDKLINSVNFDDYDSMQYFQNFIIKSGLMDALKNAGLKKGNTVKLAGMEFDFFD